MRWILIALIASGCAAQVATAPAPAPKPKEEIVRFPCGMVAEVCGRMPVTVDPKEPEKK